jgi:hypothetical protein
MIKKDWKKEFKKLLPKHGPRESRLGATPYRDWRLVAGVFFAGLAGSVAFSVYLFVGITKENTDTNSKNSGVVLDTAKLSAVLDLFSKKETTLESLKATTSTLVDPSL